MENSRRTRHLKNDHNQLLYSPQEQNPAEEKAVLRAAESQPTIEHATPHAMLALLATLPALADTFPSVSELPVDDVVL